MTKNIVRLNARQLRSLVTEVVGVSAFDTEAVDHAREAEYNLDHLNMFFRRDPSALAALKIVINKLRDIQEMGMDAGGPPDVRQPRGPGITGI